MIESKKKLAEIGIIIVGILFLTFKFVQSYITKHRVGNEIQIEIPLNFNLEEAKKMLSNIGGIKEKAGIVEKHMRDILRKPDELTTLEQKALYGGIDSAETPVKEQPLALEGIMVGGTGENLAIISGKVVAEGEMIGSARIVKIDPGRVVLIKNGSEIELKR